MPTHHIFSLPQELQEMIFEFAYAKPSATTIVRLEYEPQYFRPWARPPAKDVKVSEWLINKRWFVSAARAYAESSTMPIQIIGRAEDGIAITGILHAFARTMSIENPHLNRLTQSQCPRLRRLEIRYSPAMMDRPLPRGTTRLSKRKLQALDVYGKLLHDFTDLREMKIFGNWTYDSDLAMTGDLSRLILQAQKRMRRRVRWVKENPSLKVEAAEEHEDTPLYANSKVRAAPSCLSRGALFWQRLIRWQPRRYWRWKSTSVLDWRDWLPAYRSLELRSASARYLVHAAVLVEQLCKLICVIYTLYLLLYVTQGWAEVANRIESLVMVAVFW